MQRPYTISIEEKTLASYKIFCKSVGFLPSKRIELLMKRDMKGGIL